MGGWENPNWRARNWNPCWISTPTEQNLAKAHYLAGKLKPRFSGPFFNEFVVSTGSRQPEEINAVLLDRKIIGGLPLGRFYPELSGAMLLCATEMSHRKEMDKLAEVYQC